MSTEHNQVDEHDDMSIDDVMSASELYEQDRTDEARLDAEDDARHAREAAEAEAAEAPYDTEPWLGYAEGDER